jgi:hypothetical protein
MMFPSDEALFNATGEMVTGIESGTLTAVFEHWMERLEWVSKNNADYIQKLPVGSFTFLQCLSGTKLLNLSGTPYILWSVELQYTSDKWTHSPSAVISADLFTRCDLYLQE